MVATVVAGLTPERLAGALTYEGFVAIAKPEHRPRFRAHEIEVHLTEQQWRPFYGATPRPAGIVLLGEDWCPDVQRTLPLLHRLAEKAGWKLGVLRRDENLEIMAQFPGRGDVPRIPTVLFLDTAGRLLASWTERPRVAQEEIARYQEQIPEPERDMDAFHWAHRQE